MMEDLLKFAIKRVEGLESGEAVGAGSYGSVCAVKVHGRPCIAKRLHQILINLQHVDKEQSDAALERFISECNILSRLRHPNIVRFVGIYLKGMFVHHFVANCYVGVAIYYMFTDCFMHVYRA